MCEVQKNDTFELVGCFVKRLGAPALEPAVRVSWACHLISLSLNF